MAEKHGRGSTAQTNSLQKPLMNQLTNIDIMKPEDGRWMELGQDRVQWRALELAALNLRILLPELVN
jgi:hypothetical protein